MSTKGKVDLLSTELQSKIVFGERKYNPDPETPVTNFLIATKRHCNGGRTVDAGLWLKNHIDNGGKIFLSMSGAGSSFQLGILIAKMIRKGKISGISVTGANLEESLYRYVAHSHYAYIPNYENLTPQEEEELARAGLRRITDTFLPEEESVGKTHPQLEKLWKEAQGKGESWLWHDYFMQLFERDMIEKDSEAKAEECWLYEAWKYKIPVFVPGREDSTMGNIFSHACYNGKDSMLSKYKLEEPIDPSVIKPPDAYMHKLAEWYMDITKDSSVAFLQLGGGIAADFPICVAPHLKDDYFHDETEEKKDEMVKPWAGFIEIYSSPMSFGSYSGAGPKEKITWKKLNEKSYGVQIFGDYTTIFPDIAAIILNK